jgi:hypothetical protein
LQTNPALTQLIIDKRNEIDTYLTRKIDQYESQPPQPFFIEMDNDYSQRKRNHSEYGYYRNSNGNIVNPKWGREVEVVQSRKPNLNSPFGYECYDENYEIEEVKPNLRKYKGKDGSWYAVPPYYK